MILGGGEKWRTYTAVVRRQKYRPSDFSFIQQRTSGDEGNNSMRAESEGWWFCEESYSFKGRAFPPLIAAQGFQSVCPF